MIQDYQTQNKELQSIGQRLLELVRAFNDSHKLEVSCCGVTLQQSFVLQAFRQNGVLTMSQISDKINVATSTATRIIDNLVRNEMVKRQPHPDDRRTVLISLTPTGQKTIENLNNRYDEFLQNLLSHLPEGKIEEVFHALEILTSALNKTCDNC